MEPLLNRINERATIRIVEEHMKSFMKIRHFYTVVNCDEGAILPSNSVERKRNGISEDKMLQKIGKSEYINRTTKEYLDMILQAINSLDAYDRKIILLKFYYEMDDEEMCVEFGFSERKIWEDLKSAKVKLAFLMGCECYIEE